jgi:hypothetical protein
VPNINKKTSEIIVNWSNISANTTGFVDIQMNPNYEFLTPVQIAAQLQTEIRAANVNLSGFEIVYGPAPNVPYFTYDSGSSNILVGFQPLTYNSAAYPYPSSTKQLFDLLGFTNQNITPLALIGSGMSTFCQATRYVDIVCSQLTYNQPLKDTTTQQIARDSLCRLYLADGNGFGNNTAVCDASNFTPPGCAPFTIYRQFQTPKMINWNSAGKAYQPVPGVLKFEVFDDAGANLTEMVTDTDLFGTAGDYSDWSATILVSEN